jgi:hypothetical protein
MENFTYTTAEDLENTRFGGYLLDIVQHLKLPMPKIRGLQLKKWEKQGCWGIKAVQPGRETEPKTEEILVKRVGDSRDNALDIGMQELIGRLCGRHFQELKDHYSHPFGRRAEDGEALDYENEHRGAVKRPRLYYQDLENHINELETGRYAELTKNDELRAQLQGKDKKIQELEELVKAQEEKFKEQDKKFQNQEKRVREKNKQIRELKEVIVFNEIEIEVERDFVEKLRAEKRDLQEKTEALAEELEDYKTKFAEEGYAIVEEEVEAEE